MCPDDFHLPPGNRQLAFTVAADRSNALQPCNILNQRRRESRTLIKSLGSHIEIRIQQIVQPGVNRPAHALHHDADTHAGGERDHEGCNRDTQARQMAVEVTHAHPPDARRRGARKQTVQQANDQRRHHGGANHQHEEAGKAHDHVARQEQCQHQSQE